MGAANRRRQAQQRARNRAASTGFVNHADSFTGRQLTGHGRGVFRLSDPSGSRSQLGQRANQVERERNRASLVFSSYSPSSSTRREHSGSSGRTPRVTTLGDRPSFVPYAPGAGADQGEVSRRPSSSTLLSTLSTSPIESHLDVRRRMLEQRREER